MTTKRPPKIALALLVFLVMSSISFTSGYQPDMATAWKEASIVVLGTTSEVDALDEQAKAGEDSFGVYVMKVEKTFKGDSAQDRLEFIDPHDRTSASLWIMEGKRYLVFLQTAEDRKKHQHYKDEKLGTALSGLCVFEVDDDNRGAIEEAITMIQAYQSLPQGGRKAFLLENVSVTNRYIRPMIHFEVLRARISEAIPYYQSQLSRAKDEEQRLYHLSSLRCLGAPGVKATLVAWLTDDSIKTKTNVFEEMVRLGDKSVIPEIRKWIGSKDDRVAVSARSALLRLGENDAQSLLLEMIQRSKDPVARYNAIHYLIWLDQKEPFTDEEKATIQALVNDEQESVARVAGFIIEKWKLKSNRVGAGFEPAPPTPPAIRVRSTAVPFRHAFKSPRALLPAFAFRFGPSG